MTSNAGTMPGNQQPPKPPVDWAEVLKDIACECHKSIKPNKQSTCRELGNQKHDCCNKAIQQRKNKTEPGRQEQLAPERGYTSPSKPPPARINMTRQASWISGKNRGSCWPDAMLLDEKGNPKQLFDFKFRCPEKTRTRRKRGGGWLTCTGKQATPKWGKGQLKKYKALGQELGIDNTSHPPTIINNEGCT